MVQAHSKIAYAKCVAIVLDEIPKNHIIMYGVIMDFALSHAFVYMNKELTLFRLFVTLESYLLLFILLNFKLNLKLNLRIVFSNIFTIYQFRV